MMSAAGSSWQWRVRAQAPEAAAAVAWGEGVERLHACLVRGLSAVPGRWWACASRDMLVVQGEAAALPWVDGVAYAAPCTEAPALWLPTLWEPDLPRDLLSRALLRVHGRQPLLLWRHPMVVVPLDRLQPVTPALLARFTEHWHGPRTA